LKIELAGQEHYQYILSNDKHIIKELLQNKIRDKEIIIAVNDDNKNIGWLRYSYFWDNTPFMNMLYLDIEYRNIGIGKDLVLFWENEMKTKGHELIMTSTLANEQAQHFYRKLGYKDSGCLLLPKEPLEIVFTKEI
jgi:ribosomal protein S18 acetylase RimI-like enzyme